MMEIGDYVISINNEYWVYIIRSIKDNIFIISCISNSYQNIHEYNVPKDIIKPLTLGFILNIKPCMPDALIHKALLWLAKRDGVFTDGT